MNINDVFPVDPEKHLRVKQMFQLVKRLINNEISVVGGMKVSCFQRTFFIVNDFLFNIVGLRNFNIWLLFLAFVSKDKPVNLNR